MKRYELIQGDCLEVMRGMADSSFDAIITDPPYFKVKGEAWDNQWNTPEKFIEWIGELCNEWFRLLKPNGSLYVFASPKMAARVECKITEKFSVLNHIVWNKTEQSFMAQNDVFLRQFVPTSERIIFAEHKNAETFAKDTAGYVAKCDELRGKLFEPLRGYLESEMKRAGVHKEDLNEAMGFRRQGGEVSRHYFSKSQFHLPNAKNYQKMREALSQLNHGGEYLTRPYEEISQEYKNIWQQFEAERQQFEAIRRPFFATTQDKNADVWTFKNVPAYKGKHVCEKPLDLMTHIVKSSTRENALVLDCFAGSGQTGVACVQNNRRFVGIEIDSKWVESARHKIERALNAQPLFQEAAA